MKAYTSAAVGVLGTTVVFYVLYEAGGHVLYLKKIMASDSR